MEERFSYGQMMGRRALIAPYLTKKGTIPCPVVGKIIEAKGNGFRVFVSVVRAPDLYQGTVWKYGVVYRALTRNEYEVLHQLRPHIDRGVVLDRCILYPDGLSSRNIQAGVIESVYDEIEFYSSWGSMENLAEVQDKMRERVGSTGGPSVMTCDFDLLIAGYFKGIDPNKLGELDAFRTIELLSLVEKVVQQSFDIRPKPESMKSDDEVVVMARPRAGHERKR